MQRSLFAPLRRAQPELPPYTVRVSPRARRMWLQVSRWGRVVVVVPKRHTPRGIERFVSQHRVWIERTMADFADEYGPAPRMVLPTRLVLRATGETWTVQFRRVPGATPRLREAPDERLVIEADVLTADVWAGLLRKWLQRHARERLTPWVGRVAAEMGACMRRVQVRGQRTRWGSCSDRGTISINYSLLFLPPRLVRYLFVHELCHLKYLDHSPRFWSRVAEFSPNWRRLDRELRAARRTVPDWVEIA